MGNWKSLFFLHKLNVVRLCSVITYPEKITYMMLLVTFACLRWRYLTHSCLGKKIDMGFPQTIKAKCFELLHDDQFCLVLSIPVLAILTVCQNHSSIWNVKLKSALFLYIPGTWSSSYFVGICDDFKYYHWQIDKAAASQRAYENEPMEHLLFF